jgi:hypothetical protein
VLQVSNRHPFLDCHTSQVAPNDALIFFSYRPTREEEMLVWYAHPSRYPLKAYPLRKAEGKNSTTKPPHFVVGEAWPDGLDFTYCGYGYANRELYTFQPPGR